MTDIESRKTKLCLIRSKEMLLRILLVALVGTSRCDSVTDHRFTMNSHRQEHLIQQRRAPQDLLHEVVFAVRQKNSEHLEAELLERSTPESPKYQRWMTFDEVGDFTSNPVGAGIIKDWLILNNATITWESLHNDYIKATAPVQVWEYLFSTEFHEWEDTGAQDMSSKAPDRFTEEQRAAHQSTFLILAKEYTIPIGIREHLETAFNTVQVNTSLLCMKITVLISPIQTSEVLDSDLSLLTIRHTATTAAKS